MLQLIKHNISIVAFLVVSIIGMFAVYHYFSPDDTNSVSSLAEVNDEGQADEIQAISTSSTIPPVDGTPAYMGVLDEPQVKRVGIIAGHRGFDSGTVCSDGLTEVQVTNSLAEKVASLLRASGIETETLDEFDRRLDGYKATALVSIHIDSCDYINELASGFKVSGSNYTDSSELSICVQQAYGNATQLEYHPNSITPEMAGYHAFREIGDSTPAIIIEVGFLNLDRGILIDGIDDVARGLRDGIICYMDQQS
ncbi:MAG: N-acetylmuramoyl-L-alanine amidase [Candidatus Promineifilaceae bacterium]